jgi:hypothetical protein
MLRTIAASVQRKMQLRNGAAAQKQTCRRDLEGQNATTVTERVVCHEVVGLLVDVNTVGFHLTNKPTNTPHVGIRCKVRRKLGL